VSARPRPDDDLSAIPAVRLSLTSPDGQEPARFAVLPFGGEPFQVAAVSIELGGFVIGALLVGDHLQSGFLRRIGSSFEGALAVMASGQLLTFTEGPDLADGPAVLAALRDVDPSAEQPLAVRIAGREYVAAALPLGVDQAGRPVVLHLLRSLSATVAPFRRALLIDLSIFGLVAVGLAGVGAAAATRSTLRPFRGFVEFMRSVAASGNYRARYATGEAPSEIRTLNETYQDLIASLRRQHDELEQRTADLAEAHQRLLRQIEERESAERALQESEEQLRHAQKMEALGTLAGGVAHDFNNLLSVIMSYVELLLNERSPEGHWRPDLEQIRHAAQRAALLTQQLLAFGRKQVLQPRVLDLNQVVAGMETMLGRLVREDIRLTTSPGLAIPRIKADHGQIEQVIVNLAVNARDAMPTGGTLVIRTGSVDLAQPRLGRHATVPPGRWVTLSVEDTGSGIDPDLLPHIFEPFFTTKEAGKGTGLGLAMVYGIVQQSGGVVLVETTPGQGTTFTVYLPAVPVTDGAMTPDGVPMAAPHGTETILLVEDEEPVRLLAQRILKDHGYDVMAAGSGAEALDRIREFPGRIHLMLTDVIMPAMSGRELADQVAVERPDTRVLFVSGYTDDALARHGVLRDGTHLLHKPFTPRTLAERVRRALDEPVGVG
jgi:signal transduction histidine kinase/ActR/RegA family two-component response regulator